MEKKKTKLFSTNDNYQEYLSQGGEIMKKIATRYVSASPIGKKKIIGSIFAGKLIFSENKYRTTEPNVILELIIIDKHKLKMACKSIDYRAI